MTRREALKILGLSGNETETEIKKKYRSLMKRIHPDALINKPDSKGSLSPQTINEAYALLKSSDSYTEPKKKTSTENAIKAPINPNAFSDRELLSYVEDSDGKNIGDFSLGRGKFIWQIEEDFPLFLKSIYLLSCELLDNCERDCPKTVKYEEREQIQAHLAYLLAQQYVDGSYTLNKLSQKEDDDVYYIPSMLEKLPGVRVHEGQNLIPAYIRNHRLFLNDISGNIAGYVSFKDDRFYYSVIPLFEQKRGMIKVKISKMEKRFISLDLWVKIDTAKPGFPENINISIENLLKKYSGK